MTQQQLALYRLDVPFTTAFAHSSAVRTETQSVWVEASSDGLVGVGEGCPREYVTGESLASVQAFFASHGDALCQDVQSAQALAAWTRDHTEIIDTNPAAWCAIELALLDLFAQRDGVSVDTLLSQAPPTGQFRYSAVVGDSGLETFRKTVTRYQKTGFVDFKLKLSNDVAKDREKIVMLLDLNIEGLRIRVDANNLWTDAESAVRHLVQLGVSFVGIEEPLPVNAFDAMRVVSRETGSRIILDESFLRRDQMQQLRRDPEQWVINARVSKLGGLFRSLGVVQDARKVGIPLIVGAQVGETSVLTRAGLIVAVAAGDGLLAQEGAFGTHLLETDVAEPPLMFGAAGTLDVDTHRLSARPGWGLVFTKDRACLTPLSSQAGAGP